MTECRQKVEVLHDILGSLEGSCRGSWEIVTHSNMNSDMWKRYRARMLELALIREVEFEPGRAGFEITPRGRDLLGIIRAYRSIWPP